MVAAECKVGSCEGCVMKSPENSEDILFLKQSQVLFVRAAGENNAPWVNETSSVAVAATLRQHWLWRWEPRRL